MGDQMERHQGPSSEKKTQLQAYAKVDTELPGGHSHMGCIPVMVTITAPSGLEEQREPVDLVLVLHVRNGSNVPENWQELLMVALKVVIGKLGSEDCLAVVPLVPTLLLMSDKKTIAVLSQYEPHSIKTDASLMRDLESAESILNGRAYEDKKTRAGYIIVISNSEDDMSSLLTWRFLNVHAFGFRDAHNAWAMHTIASNRDCIYAILDDEHGRITQAFTASIDRITSPIAVMPIEIQLSCNDKVDLFGIGALRISYYISDNKKNATIWARAHLHGMPTNFIVYLYTGNLKQDEHNDLSKVLTVHAKYYQNPGASRLPTNTNFPKVQHSDRGVVEVLDGMVLTVKEGMAGSKEVAAEIVRFEAIKIINAIIQKNKPDWNQLQDAAKKQRDRWTNIENYDDGGEVGSLISGLAPEVEEDVAAIISENKIDWEQLHAAADMLSKQWATLEDSKCAREAGGLISRLSSEMQEMEIRLYNNYLWPEYMLSWQLHQWWQLPLPPLFMDKQGTDDHPAVWLRILAKVDDIPPAITEPKKGLPMLVRVMAPEVALAKVKRTPVDVVVVLDTEKKTQKKLELVIKAMEVVREKLDHEDRIAIIPVQPATTQPAARFMDMSKGGRKETSAKVQSIVVRKLPTTPPDTRATQPPHWREQLSKAIKFIRKCLRFAPTNSPIPNPTYSGSQGTPSIMAQSDGGTKLWKALMDAVKLLDDRQEKYRLGFIIVISDSDGDFILQETFRPQYTVHGFGFHDCGTHNIRAMHYIASSCNDGIYATIDDHRSKVTKAFRACINKITSTVAVDTEIGILCSNPSSDIALSTIESGKFRSAIGRKYGSILAGTLYAGAVRNFIVYVDKVREDDYVNFSKLFTVHVKWLHAFRREEEKLDGQVVVVKDGIDGSLEVVTDIIRVKAVKIISKLATNPNYKKKLVADKLQNICHGSSRVVMEIQKIVANLHREIDMQIMEANLSKEMETENVKNLRKDITDPEYYRKLAADKKLLADNKKLVADQLSYMLSWLSFQGLSEHTPMLL